MLAKPGEVGLRRSVADQPAIKRMTRGKAPADEVERQEHDLLSPLRLVVERRIGGFEKVGCVDMGRHDLGIDGAERLDGSHDASANRQHDRDESAPAAPEGRPPAELAAIPGRDARLVQRRVPEDAAPEALGDAAGIFRDELGIGRIREGAVDPLRQAVMDEVDDRLDAQVEQPTDAFGRRNPSPNDRAQAGCGATAPRSGRPKRRARRSAQDPPPIDRNAR